MWFHRMNRRRKHQRLAEQDGDGRRVEGISESKQDGEQSCSGHDGDGTVNDATTQSVVELDHMLTDAGYEQPVHVSAARILGYDGWEQATVYHGIVRQAQNLSAVMLLPSCLVNGQMGWIILPVNAASFHETWPLVSPSVPIRARAFVRMSIAAHAAIEAQQGEQRG